VEIVTNKNWEARPPGGQWVSARQLSKHGSQPWGTVLNSGTASLPAGQSPPVRAALVKNDFLMRTLGRPHRDQVVTTRPNELTTLQAIDLANGDILASYLKAGAKQFAAKVEKKETLVTWVFRHALCRIPTTTELSVLNEVVGDQPEPDPVALEDLLWLVFMQPEFQIIR
jgi:hypothetical protein